RVFMRIAKGPIGVYERFITEVSNTIVLPAIYSLAGIGLWIDRNIVDAFVNGVANFVLKVSASVRRIQTGFLQHYALGMVIGIMVIILIYSLVGGG
ncbi:MAG: Na+/H+ antiporter subunit D, partial [Nitrospirota bacterium]|nr:Na+/H+ antiporter subunit D [Nitrospirota bacterium]